MNVVWEAHVHSIDAHFIYKICETVSVTSISQFPPDVTYSFLSVVWSLKGSTSTPQIFCAATRNVVWMLMRIQVGLPGRKHYLSFVDWSNRWFKCPNVNIVSSGGIENRYSCTHRSELSHRWFWLATKQTWMLWQRQVDDCYQRLLTIPSRCGTWLHIQNWLLLYHTVVM